MSLLLTPVFAALSLGTIPSSPSQNLRQDVNRLALLPGPNLTSPHASFTGQTSIASEVKFVPAAGTLHLSSSSDKPREFAPPTKPQPLVHPDALRFEEKLPPTPLRTPQTQRPAR